jgi:hypothetical protein
MIVSVVFSRFVMKDCDLDHHDDDPADAEEAVN